MRTFLCLPIDEALRERLSALGRNLRERVHVRASWVRPENYHVTVRFLGEIDPMLTIPLRDACDIVAARIPPFGLRIDRLGAFPSAERARVLWAGGDGPPPFRALVSSVEDELTTLGFERGREAAVSHVTVARIKGRPDGSIREAFDALRDVPEWVLRVERLALMESELTPYGARYNPLFSLPLRGVDRDAAV